MNSQLQKPTPRRQAGLMAADKNMTLAEANKTIIQQMTGATRREGLTVQADLFASEVIKHGMAMSESFF